MRVSMHIEFEDGEQKAIEAVGAMLKRLNGAAGSGCQCEPAGVHWPTISVDVAAEGADRTVEMVVDAGTAFGTALGVDMNGQDIPTPPVDPGFAERTAHLNGVMTGLSAPPPPPAAGIPVTNPVELDSRGLPWDRRIHASTRTKCQDGTWKNIRGVDKDILTSVEAELRGAMAAPPAACAVPASPATLSDAAAASAQLQTPPAPPVPLTASTTPAPVTYAEMMLYITSNASAKRFTYQDVIRVCQDNGLAGIPLMNARPDMIPTIHAALEAICLTPA